MICKKLRVEQHETYGEVGCSGNVSSCCYPKGKRRVTHVLALYGLSAMHYKITNDNQDILLGIVFTLCD